MALPEAKSDDSLLTIRYAGITSGLLSGGTVVITTGIRDGSLWNMDILHNDMIRDHEGQVLAYVTGTATADGVYAYLNPGLVGFNVNIAGSGTLFSVEQDAFSNEVTLMLGANSLTFSYRFDLPNDNGISTGAPILNGQLPAVTSGSGTLVYNGQASLAGNVTSLGATTVPEPATMALLAMGLAGLGWRRFRG